MIIYRTTPTKEAIYIYTTGTSYLNGQWLVPEFRLAGKIYTQNSSGGKPTATTNNELTNRDVEEKKT